MAIKFSGGTPTYTIIRNDTSANIRGDMDAVLLAQGWTHLSTLTNGYVYQVTSPQGLVARCRIQDTGATNFPPLSTNEHYIEIQFGGPTGATQGATMELLYSATNSGVIGGYQMIAGPCQFFVSKIGVTDRLSFSQYWGAVAGGIPSIPDTVSAACGDTGASGVTELWWSCGHGPELCIRTSRWWANYWSMGYNGVVTQPSATEAYSAFPLQLLTLTWTSNVDFFFNQKPRTLRYNDAAPLILDATLACRWKIYGQLWDAFQKSRDTTLDEVVTTVEADNNGNPYTAAWQAWNYGISDTGGKGTYFATLYLLRGAPRALTPAANDAY